jgi:hypothetical protein
MQFHQERPTRRLRFEPANNHVGPPARQTRADDVTANVPKCSESVFGPGGLYAQMFETEAEPFR